MIIFYVKLSILIEKEVLTLIQNKNLLANYKIVYGGTNDINFETGEQTLDNYISLQPFRKIEGGKEHCLSPNVRVFLYDNRKVFIKEIPFGSIFNTNEIESLSFIRMTPDYKYNTDSQIKPWTNPLKQILKNTDNK